jgi:hypothetical protein
VAIGTYFNNINLELTELATHASQFVRFSDSASVGAQFISIYIVQFHEVITGAGRAVPLGTLPVEFGSLEEVRVSITEITVEGAPSMEFSNIRSSRETVIHHIPWFFRIGNGFWGWNRATFGGILG